MGDLFVVIWVILSIGGLLLVIFLAPRYLRYLPKSLQDPRILTPSEQLGNPKDIILVVALTLLFILLSLLVTLLIVQVIRLLT